MLPGMVDPQKLMETQKVSQHVKAVIRVDYDTQIVAVGLSSEVPEGAAIIPELLDSFATSLAQQFSTMFAIKGEIIEVNRPK